MNEVLYTIGIIDGDSISFIGWCNRTDYYESVETDCFADTTDDIFTEYLDLDEDEPIEVGIYKCNTLEEAEEERRYAQKEYDAPVVVIKLKKQGGWWYPDFGED